jgi:hypothetical protein
MNMIKDPDTQVRNATILEGADLDAVSGGDVHDAAVRTALGFLFNGALTRNIEGEEYRAIGPCYR